jgi:hypothetical protein
MIYHPAILALLVGSLLISSMLLYSSFYGVQIIRSWDIRSGSEVQLDLERRTYLISTVMSYALGFQLLSLFLFVFTADQLSTMFVGAMCAAGTLNVNEWGYPTILLKLGNFLLAGLWLIVNYTDNRAYDYPLIKKKYALLLFITPFILAEMVTQGCFFLGLKPDIITSCCGTLFTEGAEGATGGIVSLPRIPVEMAFYTCMAVSLALGLTFYLKGKAAYLFSLSSLIAFPVSIVALISFICVYFYELPTHHCPYCILQREYGYVGYVLYLSLLGGGVFGLGVGAVMPFRRVESLKVVLPLVQRRLTLLCLVSYGLFMAVVGYGILFSNLKLDGY